jgi:uncharacterized protein DUF4192
VPGPAAHPCVMRRNSSSQGARRSRIPSNSPPAAGQPPVKVGSPAEVLAAVPYLLGFHPARSLVVIGARPPRERIRVSFRYDLPDPPAPAHAREIAAHAAAVFAREKVTVAIVVGYGPGALVTPAAEALRAALADGGIELREMLRVEDGRYWSYLCADPACCAAEGVPFDVSAHPVAARLTVAGNVTLPGRAALQATIAPLGGRVRLSMREATARAQQRAAALVAQAARSGVAGRALLRPVIEDGLRAVTEAIGTYRGGGRIDSDDELAWLTVTLADLRVRDDAWARMEPAHAAAHRRLWTDVVRRAELCYVPAPACLLAFAAWQAGDGALANVALERALASDPGYTMALLLVDAVAGGLPPSAAKLPMTPEEVAASYAVGEGKRRPARRRPSA